MVPYLVDERAVSRITCDGFLDPTISRLGEEVGCRSPAVRPISCTSIRSGTEPNGRTLFGMPERRRQTDGPDQECHAAKPLHSDVLPVTLRAWPGTTLERYDCEHWPALNRGSSNSVFSA
jgi:hypothetical protein